MKLRPILNLARAMMYVNDTIILLRHENQTDPRSPAQIVYANEDNFPDVLAFRTQQYTGHFARLYGLENFRNVFRKEDIRDSWSKGDTVCLAYLNGVCVHRCWVVRGPQTVFLQFPFLRLKLEAKDAYAAYAETVPEARGKNITAHVLSQVSKDLEEKGFRVYGAVQERNVPAIRADMKAGFRQIEKVRLVGLLGIRVKRVVK
jgi:GNAT superfamily N-acetyltransferase